MPTTKTQGDAMPPTIEVDKASNHKYNWEKVYKEDIDASHDMERWTLIVLLPHKKKKSHSH